MKTRMAPLAASCLVALFTGVSFGGETPEAVLKKLAGTWELVSKVTDGESTSAEEAKDVRLVVKGTDYEVRKGDKSTRHGTIKIVEADEFEVKLDVTFDRGDDMGKTVPLFLEWLDDGVFRSCRSLEGTARPTDFTFLKGSGHEVATFKKVP